MYKGGRVVASFNVTKKEGRVVTSGQFLKKGLPGRVDTSGTKKTIKTGKLWKCDLPRRKIQNKEVDLIRRYMLTWYLSRGGWLDREVLCMDGMMTCQVQFVARVSHVMR